MKNWKKLAAIVLLAATSVAAGMMPAHAQSLTDVKSRGTINVGVLEDYPPFGLVDNSGKVVGFDPDLAQKFADQIGVKLNIVPVTSANRVQYLLAGQVDVLFASLGITAERAKVIDFSQPYAGLEQFVYGNKDLTIAKAADLAGQTIGVTRGTTQDTEVTQIAPSGTNIQRYDDDAASTQALLSGQVPLLGIADLAIEQVDKTAPGRFTKKFSMLQQKQGIAVRKGNATLLAAINDFLTKEKQSGDLDKVYQTWMKAPLPVFIAKSGT